MDRTDFTQQTSSAVRFGSEFVHDAPEPLALPHIRFRSPLQWALEGRGWSVLRVSADVVALLAATALALGGTAQLSDVNAPLAAFPAVVVLLFYLKHLYGRQLRTLVLDSVVPVISGVSVAAMTVAMVGLFVNGALPEQSSFVKVWLFSLLAVSMGRVGVALAQRWARARRLVGKPVLIVGAGLVGAQVARRLERHPEYGLTPVGFLDEEPRSLAEVGGRDVPVVGSVEDLDKAITRTRVAHVIVAFSSVTDERVSHLVRRCQELNIDVSVVPRMYDSINSRVRYDTVGGLPLMSLTAVNPQGMQFAVKHALDRFFATLLLVAAAPVLLIAMLAVRLTSPGPAIFAQSRVGRDGRVFRLYKLRSMRVSAEEDEGERSGLEMLLGGDTAPGGVEGQDRRTAVGRFLRRTSLDELPQLFNVLRGDMSLVGPRPERPEFVELFRHDVLRYGDRHRVKSGITGWAQVHGLRGQTSLPERIEWDNYYITNWSLGLDVKILLLTFVALFRHAE